MRRFTLRLIVALLAFFIGITAAMLVGKINPFHHSRSHCVNREWTPPPPPPAPAAPEPPAAPDAPRR